MTQNPYVQLDPNDPLPPSPSGSGSGSEGSRLSLLAIFSLVSSAICCLPGLGALGVLLGGISILLIAMSGGRTRGMGFAITGVILGTVVTFIWIVVLISGAQLIKQSGQVTGRVLTAIDSGDLQALDREFAIGVTVTQEELDDFGAIIREDFGSFESVPEGLLQWGTDLASFDRRPQFQQEVASRATLLIQAQPWPARFSSGRTLVAVFVDTSTYRVHEVAVMRPDGSVIWLIDSEVPIPSDANEESADEADADPEPVESPDADG